MALVEIVVSLIYHQLFYTGKKKVNLARTAPQLLTKYPNPKTICAGRVEFWLGVACRTLEFLLNLVASWNHGSQLKLKTEGIIIFACVIENFQM